MKKISFALTIALTCLVACNNPKPEETTVTALVGETTTVAEETTVAVEGTTNVVEETTEAIDPEKPVGLGYSMDYAEMQSLGNIEEQLELHGNVFLINNKKFTMPFKISDLEGVAQPSTFAYQYKRASDDVIATDWVTIDPDTSREDYVSMIRGHAGRAASFDWAYLVYEFTAEDGSIVKIEVDFNPFELTDYDDVWATSVTIQGESSDTITTLNEVRLFGNLTLGSELPETTTLGNLKFVAPEGKVVRFIYGQNERS